MEDWSDLEEKLRIIMQRDIYNLRIYGWSVVKAFEEYFALMEPQYAPQQPENSLP